MKMQRNIKKLAIQYFVTTAQVFHVTKLIDNEAFKLIPCAQVKKLGQNPSCLCAVLLSNVAKMSGVNPQIASTIPKRCNLADRPVGYKCGRK
ncbi:putative bifunctional inhibitor/plant lipid transfer protein/seed storage helical [Medicago truncatula]|uniref:Putative bifunctional inhibitor/plant lipid transfer protein/seed storage helical n=1 Tax=Medicago truncatula TaxID=3880 RepID=A0A396H1C1_MEDTR|nr:putative bifunctional inhibitor/plant lipid transfer protein/seed storage helical [Medicago truncatula]